MLHAAHVQVQTLIAVYHVHYLLNSYKIIFVWIYVEQDIERRIKNVWLVKKVIIKINYNARNVMVYVKSAMVQKIQIAPHVIIVTNYQVKRHPNVNAKIQHIKDLLPKQH
jgi:hypothetical protein